MGYSLKELNQTFLLDFIELTKIHFGLNKETKQSTKTRKATQADIDKMMGRR
jgi:hypothetical protein